MDKDYKYFLDGSIEEQLQASEAFVNTLTDEEKARSMSDEFAYLDEED